MKIDTPEELQETCLGVAEAFQSELMPASRKYYKELFEDQKRTPSEDDLWNLQMEDIIFILHSADRILLSRFGNPERARIMDCLVPTTFAVIARGIGTNSPDSFFDKCQQGYNKRQNQYAAWHLPRGGQDRRGELFWEYGKLQGKIYFLVNPIEVALIGLHALGLFETMTKIVANMAEAQ